MDGRSRRRAARAAREEGSLPAPRAVAAGTRRLAVYDGAGTLAPAVVAHGVGSSPRFVHDAFAGPLRDDGWRLVTYDLRGHGRSDPARDPDEHSLEAHAGDLAAVARDVGAAVVGGVSLGAHAAAVLAAEDPRVERLLACLPAGFGTLPGDGPHAAIADEVRRDGVRAVLGRSVADPQVPTWLARLLARDWPTHDERSLVAALVALDCASVPDERLLGGIGATAGVVAWEGDPGHPLAAAREWVAHLRRAALEVVTLDDVGRDHASLGRAAVRACERAGR